MNFTKKQLEKYGWKEGKNKTGISKALKPKLKFDTRGLGYDLFEDVHNSWGQRLYDEAAKNITGKKMNFAKKQLEKYGWKEGEGLGKNKTGISKALKPKLKFDTRGLGYDLYEDVHSSWGQRLYDEAAKNISSKKLENGCVVLETIGESIEITKKKNKPKKEELYKDFVKTSELSDRIERRVVEEEEEETKIKNKKWTSGICELTDEELFRVCGGRTAHKGARHGLKMSAKLSRIENQELSLLRESSVDVTEDVQKKHEKRKKKKLDSN